VSLLSKSRQTVACVGWPRFTAGVTYPTASVVGREAAVGRPLPFPYQLAGFVIVPCSSSSVSGNRLARSKPFRIRQCVSAASTLRRAE
jgi:hypothetical protein